MAKTEPVKVVSGSLAAVKQPVTAVVEFDYSRLAIDGKPEAEYLAAQDDKYRADWAGVVATSETFFAPMFDKYIKNGMKIDPAATPQYKIVVRIESLSLGSMGQMFNPFSGVKGGGAVISGTLCFINLATGEVDCTVSFTDVQGSSAYTEGQRWGVAYMYLMKNLGKLVKKA